jgi:hypothetical protein
MQMRLTQYPKAIALSSSLALMLATPLSATAMEGDHPPAAEDQALGEGAALAHELDDQTKHQFAAAYADVLKVQNKYSRKLQGAADETEAREIQQRAQEEMVEAVRKANMSIDRYNEVVELISESPALLQEIEELAQAR